MLDLLSDELAGGQELDELVRASTVVRHDRASGAWGSRRDGLD
jgi:hypothetical protein